MSTRPPKTAHRPTQLALAPPCRRNSTFPKNSTCFQILIKVESIHPSIHPPPEQPGRAGLTAHCISGKKELPFRTQGPPTPPRSSLACAHARDARVCSAGACGASGPASDGTRPVRPSPTHCARTVTHPRATRACARPDKHATNAQARAGSYARSRAGAGAGAASALACAQGGEARGRWGRQLPMPWPTRIRSEGSRLPCTRERVTVSEYDSDECRAARMIVLQLSLAC